MKAYKFEVVVIDFDQYGPEEIKNILEGNRYISPSASLAGKADIGIWHDDHPLNKNSTFDEECIKLFKSGDYTIKDKG